jgi:hypothetical protein
MEETIFCVVIVLFDSWLAREEEEVISIRLNEENKV